VGDRPIWPLNDGNGVIWLWGEVIFYLDLDSDLYLTGLITTPYRGLTYESNWPEGCRRSIAS
jgi:hypothetical protein